MNPPPARKDGKFCGVIFGGGDKAILHVPLLQSIIHAVVIDVSCRVTVTQRYRNDLDEPIPTARYVFPVPSHAAICAFSMMTEDDHLVYAKAKDKAEAMKDFEEAVGEGKAAALQEQVSGDIFRISLGSIPARGTISTKTVFIMDLMNYDFLSNKVQLLLPLALGQRYGTLPEQLEDASGNTGRVKLMIEVEIQMSGRILSVISPSHPSLGIHQYTTHYGRPSRRRVTAKFRSETFLDRDFELVIQASELERSRCFSEKDPRLPDTIALQLTLIPHFDLPPIPKQEYLFLIDRSGSMQLDGRIEMAKQCVTLLLRCLPKRDTVFNIFDFENNHARLWSHSRVYDDHNLEEATNYVNGLDIGGGTELGGAVKAFLGSRHTSMPTAAFILTDGEVHSGEEEMARKAIQDNMSASPDTSLRLFVLGIGNTVSSSVCATLATAGHGDYLLAVSPENILSRCTSLLYAGRTSTIRDVSVDWTADIPSGHSPSSQPVVQQSPPGSIPHVSPFTPSIYFAIMHTETIPKRVIIRGKANGKDVFISVDVESAKFSRKLSGPPFIHTLAARGLIRDLEEGNAKGKRSEAAQRREIVGLGEYYQLASSHTSFVAVDHGEVRPLHQQDKSPNSSTTAASLIGAVWQYLTDPTSLFRTPTVTGRPEPGDRDGGTGGWSTPDQTDSGVSSESDVEHNASSEDYDDWESEFSDDTLSTLSSLESYSSVDDAYPARRPRHFGSRNRRNRTLLSEVPYAPPPQVFSTTKRTGRFKPRPIDPHVVTLVQQMSASGSFTLDTLGEIVGRDALEEARSWGDEQLVATALAMAYLEKNLGDHVELRQVLTEKGMEFVENHSGFDEILDRARKIV